ncbi:MAG: hypothetical protein JSW59_03755, partial [Phycisphaerales bacterium]
FTGVFARCVDATIGSILTFCCDNKGLLNITDYETIFSLFSIESRSLRNCYVEPHRSTAAIDMRWVVIVE